MLTKDVSARGKASRFQVLGATQIIVGTMGQHTWMCLPERLIEVSALFDSINTQADFDRTSIPVAQLFTHNSCEYVVVQPV